MIVENFPLICWPSVEFVMVAILLVKCLATPLNNTDCSGTKVPHATQPPHSKLYRVATCGTAVES